jgi:hypothetical protein
MRNSVLLFIVIIYNSFNYLCGIDNSSVLNAKLNSGNTLLQQSIHSIRAELIEIQSELNGMNSLKQTRYKKPVLHNEPVHLTNPKIPSYFPPSVSPFQNTKASLHQFPIEKSTPQKYFFGFDLGIDLPSNQNYLSGVGSPELSFKNGLSSEIEFGRYFGNFIVATSFGFRRSETDTITVPYLGELSSNGESKFFTHSVSVAYDIMLTDKMRISLLSSIGWSYADLIFTSDFIGELKAKGYLLALGVGINWKYFLTERVSLSAGYEFNGYGKNYPFGSISFHNINSGIYFHF